MSESIKEIAGVLKDALVTPVQEAFVYRARNPFFGTFIIAWLCYNWNKVAYFLLSKEEVLTRIEYIKHKIPDNSVLWGLSIPHTHSIIYPFLWACIMSVAYPFLTYVSIWIHKWITGHIEAINSQKEISRIVLQKSLITANFLNESEKTRLQAECELEVEEKKEKAANSRLKVNLLKEQRATLESEIELLESQKKSAQATLSSATSELDITNEKYNQLNSKYEILIKKHGSNEELQNAIELQTMSLNSTEQKLQESENILNDVKKEYFEQQRAYEERIISLQSKVSSLTIDLEDKNNRTEEINQQLGSLYNKERNSAKIRKDMLLLQSLSVDKIEINLLRSINTQENITENLNKIHKNMVDRFKDKNDSLIQSMTMSSELSLLLGDALESIKNEIIKLKETTHQ